MSSRKYMSIGDVLNLLREEFPDVTISKIRFLESQGLVDPERTPSGYRKFYDHDVERLKWVLRQQREHFLPLKVIKGRLEEETAAGPANGRDRRRQKAHGPSIAANAAGAKDVPAEESSASSAVSAVLVGQRAEDQPSPGPSRHASEGGLSGTDVGRAPESLRAPDSLGAAGQVLPGLERPEPVQEVFSEDRGSPVGATGPAETEPSQGRPAASGDGVRRGGGRRAATSGGAAASPRTTNVVAPMAAFSGTSMTAEELSSACGLDGAEIQKLASYGLVSGRVIGGTTYYDEDALLVGRLASAFADYGVEARHLRLHLLAAQREAGFVEQIVLPLLKQRNPASRQRAHETVSELRLGQDLRSVLLQQRLRELLGG